MTAGNQQELRQLGVGLLVVDGSTVTEVGPNVDLALNVELPDMTDAPQRLRQLMTDVHDKFARGEWRDGFKDACGVLEQESAEHLKAGVASERIVVYTDKGRPRKLTDKTIDRMTLGQLRDAFAHIQNQNLTDATIHSALDRVLDDRNTVTHPKKNARKLRRARENVGGHMWTIDSALRAICDAR